MPEHANVLIVGGGIIGTALAWALAERGVDGVVVVDLDLAGAYASSELNAGGARATWWQPVNIEACRLTLDFFREHAQDFTFRQRGYLWLYGDRALWSRALERRTVQNRLGLDVETIAAADLHRRFPLVDRNLHELVGATFSPRDGLVNPNAVRAWYRREAEARGVTFRNRHYVTGLATRLATAAGGSSRQVASLDVTTVRRGAPGNDADVLRAILTTHVVPAAARTDEMRITCATVVNCLGAWSPIFSAKVGIADVTEPVRRQVALVDVRQRDIPADVDLERLGMLVDSSGLYLHPEGGHVLAGYSIPGEPPGFDFAYDGEAFFTTEIWPRLTHRATIFERCRHLRGWAGLYAVTPDRSGIAGPVAGITNLFEAHSFTGRGVMQSFAVGRAMAAMIATGRYEHVDLSPLGRARFEDPRRWVREELHI